MNPIERVLTASKMKEPDIMPVALLAGGDFISWFTGITKSSYYGNNSKVKLAAQIKLLSRFPEILFWPGPWPDYASVIEPSSFGCGITLSNGGVPMISSHAVNDIYNAEKIAVPDITRDGFMPVALEEYKYIVDKVPNNMKTNYGYASGFAFSMGPCDLATKVLGYENFTRGIHMEGDIICKLMKIFTRTLEEWVKAQWEVSEGRNFVFIVEDSISMLSPDQFRNFVFPSIIELCGKLKRNDTTILLHNCDKVSHLINSIGKLPIDIFHHGPEFGTGWWKKEIGKKTCIAGGISPFQGLLKNYESLEKEVGSAISSGTPGGGFILSISGSVPIGTREETIMGMSSLAEKKI